MTSDKIEARLLRLAKRKARDNEAEAKLKLSRAETKRLEYELYEEMRERDIPGMKSGEFTFSRTRQIWGQVQDIDLFAEWCQDQGLATEFLTSKASVARLNELVRSYTETGEQFPPGVTSYLREGISVRSNDTKEN